MTMKALVVGGTGPTGPYLLDGLLARGYEVTIFHRGVHEPPGLPDVEHIHGDPHFKETIATALAGRQFDLVLAMYGRTRYLAQEMAGRCTRFISIGGVPAVRGQQDPASVSPFGMKASITEADPVVASAEESSIGFKLAHTEGIIFDLHAKGAFSATHLRYPQIYGPRAVVPKEWSVLRRLRDGRDYLIIPDNGLLISSRAAGKNAAHAVLLAVDNAATAAGQIYHCGDDEQFTARQWYEMMIELAGGGLRLVSLPEELAAPFHTFLLSRHHSLLDTSKIRRELAYRDVISPRDGLREAIEYCRENASELASSGSSHPDRFAYAEEDKVVQAYTHFLATSGVSAGTHAKPHFYAHPKSPGGADHRGR